HVDAEAGEKVGGAHGRGRIVAPREPPPARTDDRELGFGVEAPDVLHHRGEDRVVPRVAEAEVTAQHVPHNLTEPASSVSVAARGPAAASEDPGAREAPTAPGAWEAPTAPGPPEAPAAAEAAGTAGRRSRANRT